MAAAEVEPTPSVEFTTAQWQSFTRALTKLWGIDPDAYQEVFRRRQLGKLLASLDLADLDALTSQMGSDDAVLAAVQNAFAVPVTEMFRDPGVFSALRQYVMPELHSYPFVRVWSAGCATGEEAFALSILLSESGLDGRYRIYATDINPRALSTARSGVCSVTRANLNEANYRASGGVEDFDRYFVSDESTQLLRKQWRDPITFAVHSLISDASFNDFQLILCRNVLIYLAPDHRDRVYELLLDSMTDYGYLVLGRNETPGVGAVGRKFHVTCRESRIYRKDPLR